MPLPDRRRVVIEGIRPQVDGGRFPIKRVVGDEVLVEADVFADGHENLLLHASMLLSIVTNGNRVARTADAGLGNDRWRAKFPVDKLGTYWYRSRRLGRSLSHLAARPEKTVPMRGRICTSIY